MNMMTRMKPNIHGVGMNSHIANRKRVTYKRYHGYHHNLRRVYRGDVNINMGHSKTFTRCLYVPRSGIIGLSSHVSSSVTTVVSPFNGTARATLSFPLLNRSILVANTNLVNAVTATVTGFTNTGGVIIASLDSCHLSVTGGVNTAYAMGTSGNRAMRNTVSRLNVHNFSMNLRVSNTPMTFHRVMTGVCGNSGVTRLNVLPPAAAIS